MIVDDFAAIKNRLDEIQDKDRPTTIVDIETWSAQSAPSWVKAEVLEEPRFYIPWTESPTEIRDFVTQWRRMIEIYKDEHWGMYYAEEFDAVSLGD